MKFSIGIIVSVCLSASFAKLQVGNDLQLQKSNRKLEKKSSSFNSRSVDGKFLSFSTTYYFHISVTLTAKALLTASSNEVAPSAAKLVILFTFWYAFNAACKHMNSKFHFMLHKMQFIHR